MNSVLAWLLLRVVWLLCVTQHVLLFISPLAFAEFGMALNRATGAVLDTADRLSEDGE